MLLNLEQAGCVICTIYQEQALAELSFINLLVSSADSLCKQFGARSGPTEGWA